MIFYYKENQLRVILEELLSLKFCKTIKRDLLYLLRIKLLLID